MDPPLPFRTCNEPSSTRLVRLPISHNNEEKEASHEKDFRTYQVFPPEELRGTTLVVLRVGAHSTPHIDILQGADAGADAPSEDELW